MKDENIDQEIAKVHLAKMKRDLNPNADEGGIIRPLTPEEIDAWSQGIIDRLKASFD